MMAPTSHPTLDRSLTKSTSLDGNRDAIITTLGDDVGLGKILLGLRYQASSSCLEVRVVKGECIRSLRAADQSGTSKLSTYCSVAFLPDRTEPVITETVENSDCPHWRGAFRFEKFPLIMSSTSQRCLQVQVHNAVTGIAISEATMLLGNWKLEKFEKGMRVWKHLNSALETQHDSNVEGKACMTMLCRSDRLKLTLHRIEDLNPSWTAASEAPEFYVKLQTVMSGRVIKEATLKGLRVSVGGDVNFYDAEFNTRLNKHSHSLKCLVLRLVLMRRVDSTDHEIYWLDLGAEVKRLDCSSLYQSVIGSPNQLHVVSVRLSKAPMMPPLGKVQAKHEA